MEKCLSASELNALEILEILRKRSVTALFLQRGEEQKGDLPSVNLHPVTVARFCS